MGAEVAEFALTEFPATASGEMVADVGHFLHLENPDLVNTKILDFLQSV